MRIRKVFYVMLAVGVAVLAACGQNEIEDALEWPVEDFTFTNQEGESFGSSDLEGKVWLADFIFTNCPDICPPMTANMLKIQELAKEEGLDDIEFVSFSVDPEVDTPEVLKEFGDRFYLDYSNWNFVTGYGQDEIEAFAMDNFKTLVQKPDNEDFVIHQGYFFLVDQNGEVMKSYSGASDVPIDEIIEDMKILQ